MIKAKDLDIKNYIAVPGVFPGEFGIYFYEKSVYEEILKIHKTNPPTEESRCSLFNNLDTKWIARYILESTGESCDAIDGERIRSSTYTDRYTIVSDLPHDYDFIIRDEETLEKFLEAKKEYLLIMKDVPIGKREKAYIEMKGVKIFIISEIFGETFRAFGFL